MIHKYLLFFHHSIRTFTRQLTSSSSYPIPPDFRTLCSNGHLNEALLQMAIQGLEMNFIGYDTLLHGCIAQRAIREGQRVHTHIIKTQFESPVPLGTRLIMFYAKCEWIDDARKAFDEMPVRNVVPWTAMISAYSKRGYATDALNLFLQMLRSGTEPNEYTFATILTSCTGPYRYDYGRQFHSLMIKLRFQSHVYVGSSLLDMYAKAGRIHEAHRVFECLPERDVVSCTAIISGYAQLGFDQDALELFCRLHKEGMKSNYVTYASVLTALSGLAALEHGRQVHNHVLRNELPSNVVLQNSLIDMYSKCGNLTYSRRIFDDMSERTVISWNAMLVGYSKHGMGKEVINLFELMREENKIGPDKITFLAVLSGCSHGGMEDRGLQVFDEMLSGKYGIVPEIEHYGCVIDLLGRVGQVEKAYEFINQMPYEPTTALWGSLLGACSVHLNVDIGVLAAERLFEMEPENAGNYVMLSNLFASTGRWEDARRLRESMKAKEMMKEPGKSLNRTRQYLSHFSC